MLEQEIINEAGPWHILLSGIFDEVMKGDKEKKIRAEIVLDMMSYVVSKKCLDEYVHLYGGILSVANMNEGLKGKDMAIETESPLPRKL